MLFQIEGDDKNSDLKDKEIVINTSEVNLFSSQQQTETGEYHFNKSKDPQPPSSRQKHLDSTLQSLANKSSSCELNEYKTLISKIVLNASAVNNFNNNPNQGHFSPIYNQALNKFSKKKMTSEQSKACIEELDDIVMQFKIKKLLKQQQQFQEQKRLKQRREPGLYHYDQGTGQMMSL